MAAWVQITRGVRRISPRVHDSLLLQGRASALSCLPALRNWSSVSDENRGVEIGVTHDGDTIVCFHPASDFPYELTQPIPRPETTLHSTETHDLVLKTQLHKDIVDNKKSPGVEELAKMFYTTKHRWYPVGQYHTRRRNRNPPKDR